MIAPKRLVPLLSLLLTFLVLQPTVGANAGSGAVNGTVTERTAAMISSGSGFNCWVASGAAKCIGQNSVGQLGDGTNTNRITAVTVTGLSSGVISIAAGSAHACALLTSGAMKCWGSNTRGQLGDGTTTNSSLPVQVSGLTTGVARIDAEADNTCALTQAGRALCWGSNQTYGIGSVTPDANSDAEADPALTPVEVTGLSSDVSALAIAGYRTSATVYVSHGCAVLTSGDVKCWGSNANGALGSSVADPTATPTVVSIGVAATAIALGTSHSCALTTAGAVKCWGGNTVGQLGNGTTTAVAAGTIVDVIGASSGVDQIAAGRDTSCSLSTAGALSCWGQNIYETIKRSGTSSTVSTPEVVHGLTAGVSAVSVGDSHICALKASGDLGCWGANLYGQTGDGFDTRVTTPQSVITSASNNAPITGFQSIGTSMWSTCGVRTNGAIKCWGYNYSGQLGDLSQSGRAIAFDHSEILSGAVSVTSGGTASTHTLCGIMSDTTAKCWGSNAFGQKGFGSSVTTDYGTHTMLASIGPDVPLTGITSASVGPYSTCVVASGAAKCSGSGTAGALGNGATVASNLPVQVSGLTSGVVAVSTTGANVSCALLNTGEVKCWGNGQQYQLGNGSVANSNVPTSVTGITNATAIASGDNSTCVLVTGGAVKCWGNNTYGQIGNGTNTTAQTPASVSGLSGATAITGSSRNFCALMADTSVKCWGYNYHGVLADGTTTDSNIPVTIPGLSGVTSLAMGSNHICALMSDTTVKCWGSEQNGQIGNNTMQNRAFDGQTYVATGLSAPLSLPTIATSPPTTTTLATTTTTTVAATVASSNSTVAPSSASTLPASATTTSTVPKTAPVRIDNTVYVIAPQVVGGVSAFTILHNYETASLRAVSQTPSQCVAGGIRVITLTSGECRVLVLSMKNGKVARMWKTKIVDRAMSIGSTVRAIAVDNYKRMDDTLPNSEYKKVYEIVKSASAIVVVGHSAIFNGNSADNVSVSQRRAYKLRSYILDRGFNGDTAAVGVGGLAPMKTALNESAQAANRRVRVYFVPRSTAG